MSKDTYLTISGQSESLYKEKGSKFIAHAFAVQSEEEVKEKLDALRTQYYDARHYCYAYMLGAGADRFRANDDGEPNNSAGMPILNQIKSKDLTNVLVVVVRYFGGTKLGVSGLINAYKTAASMALESSLIIEKIISKTIYLTFPYQLTGEAMKLLHDVDAAIIKQDFDTDCTIEAEIREGLYDQFLNNAGLVYGVLVETEEKE